ncbi:MAG: hypothetical protein LBN42_01465, partial [Oscillospiraceae bacterium]|nr:hypothetical protein [Oscillospiraceae bacterium]
IENISFGVDNVTFSLLLGSKNHAAYIISALRDFTSIKFADVSTTTITDDYSPGNPVSMIVICTYYKAPLNPVKPIDGADLEDDASALEGGQA